MVSAKHYLDFETKEPQIDAMVGAIDMSGALDNIGVEDEIEEGNLGHNELASLERRWFLDCYLPHYGR
jgi:hypothetical protein